MLKSARPPAEAHFAETQRKLRQVQKDKEKAKQEVSAQVAKLRAQRLAMEAAAPDQPAASSAETRPVMPKAHRTQL